MLTEISEVILIDKEIDSENNKKLLELNEIFKNPEDDNIKKFIDDDIFRLSVIRAISKNDVKLISGFLELFSRSIDKTWERAEPKGAVLCV